MVEGPGVVTGRSGTIGLVHYSECDFWPLNTTLYVKDFKGNEPKYVALVLESMDLKTHAAGSTVPSLNRNVLENVPVRIPPLAEQQRIVDLIGSLDEAIEAAEDESRVLRAGRSSLIDAMLATCPAVKVEDLISGVNGGKSPASDGRPPEGDEFGVLKVGAVNTWGFRPEESKTVAEIGIFTEAMKVQSGDVLITRANTPEKVGAVCFVEEVGDNLYLSDKTLRLVPNSHVDSRCLVAAMNSTPARLQIQLAATGTSASMKNISQAAINKLVIGWPDSLADQRAVGMADRGWLEAISSADELAANLGTLRSELLTALLSGAHTIPASYDQPVLEIAA